jgi:hypothetical protein
LSIDARTWQLDGGTIDRLTIDDAVLGGVFQVTSDDGTLDGVTLSVDTTLLNAAQVTVLNDLTLDDITLRLERTVNSSNNTNDVGLNFSGGIAQTLGGTGEVELFSALASGFREASDVRVRPTGVGSSLTIGSGITIRTPSNSFFATLGDPTLPLTIEGIVSSESTVSSTTSLARTLRVTGFPVTTSASSTLQVLSGVLDVNNLTGTLGDTIINGGVLDLDGAYSVDQPVTVTGGLTLRGTSTIDQPVSLLSGDLSLFDDWINLSTIAQSDGTKVHLYDNFTLADLSSAPNLGNFTGTAATVNIRGTL